MITTAENYFQSVERLNNLKLTRWSDLSNEGKIIFSSLQDDVWEYERKLNKDFLTCEKRLEEIEEINTEKANDNNPAPVEREQEKLNFFRVSIKPDLITRDWFMEMVNGFAKDAEKHGFKLALFVIPKDRVTNDITFEVLEDIENVIKSEALRIETLQPKQDEKTA